MASGVLEITFIDGAPAGSLSLTPPTTPRGCVKRFIEVLMNMRLREIEMDEIVVYVMLDALDDMVMALHLRARRPARLPTFRARPLTVLLQSLQVRLGLQGGSSVSRLTT